uniref:uncharacterized protein LOC118540540 n=1 Tax=Halichoerus grypus TaxID=9711 RepID=UPI001659C716|nr:uncharacterized protein LOC118540540 [Halichoerus grypus]
MRPREERLLALGSPSPRRDPKGGGTETRGANGTCWENAPPTHTRPPPLVLESLISWQRGCRTSTDSKVFITTGGMASTPTRNEEKKGSRMSQAATPSGGGLKVSLSRSEEFLTRISTELTNEALFIAGCHMNSVPTKEKQTQDRGTQISKHVFFKTRGTDTCSDRIRTRAKAHLLPSAHDKNMRQTSSFTSH